LNNAYTAQDIADNNVPAIAYVDLRASYFLDEAQRIQTYVAVDNLLNTNPPIIASSTAAAAPFFYVPTRTDIYDSLGTTFRFGIRAKF
jgi:outer membrane receptor protein involved in Fe transport